jgi:Leucine-rich repeat (LRR) protein
METASKDVLFTIAMNLRLPDLLRWCSSSSRLNKDICNNDNVLRSKLLRDYPDIEIFHLNKSLRETYIFLYSLSYIKELLNSDESIHDIFQRKILDLSQKGLKKVPAFDLPKLQELSLSKNKLTSIPAFHLPMLRTLDLHSSNLTEVPSFDLPNLKELELYNNKLIMIPTFNLPNLQTLNLFNNNLTNVPDFYLPKLQLLTLHNNKLDKITKKELREKYQNKVVLCFIFLSIYFSNIYFYLLF